MTAQQREETIITASEVSAYFYCPYAWWYADRGVEPERMKLLQRGLDYHEAASTANAPSKWSRALLVAAGLLAAAAMVLYILGVW